MQNLFKICFFVMSICFAASCGQSTIYKPTFAVVSKFVNFSAIAEAGYDYLETTVGDFLVPSESDSAFLANLEQIKQAGAKIISCNVFLPAHLKVTGNDAVHDEIMLWAETTFSRAQMANIPYIVFGSAGARNYPDGFDKQEAVQQYTVLCKRLAPLAQKYDVTILIEPLNSVESNIINSLEEGAAVVYAVDHPNVLLLCDIFHMLRDGEPAEEIVKYGDIIRHCHIAEKETRSVPGMAGDDFRKYFDALKKINYQGCIAIEADDWDDFGQRLAPALKYIKKQYGIK